MTNACDTEELFEHICTNAKFLYSAIYGFTNQDAIQFFEECGLRTKVERGNRVFPASDHSSDVIAVLQKKMRELGVSVHLNTPVLGIGTEQDKVTGIRVRTGRGERRKLYRGRCGDRDNRRAFLSEHGIYRRRIPFCRKPGASCDPTFPLTGSTDDRGGLGERPPGTVSPERAGRDL